MDGFVCMATCCRLRLHGVVGYMLAVGLVRVVVSPVDVFGRSELLELS